MSATSGSVVERLARVERVAKNGGPAGPVVKLVFVNPEGEVVAELVLGAERTRRERKG